VTFIALYFAMFWLAWRFAVRVTEPNAVFGTRLSSAEK
jgi:membrane-associated protease RseP (regulator of RpoE activity)